MAIDKIDREELKTKLEEVLGKEPSYQRIDGLNPLHVMLDGREFYIYIKNLSPAQLTNDNENIWRVQLPIRDLFDTVKNSPATFVLLGYDAQNDVYATWNPTWVKQRLNVAKSVSFYSRLDKQVQARSDDKPIQKDLNNSGTVIIFPREQVLDILHAIDELFPDTSDYVALGSRKRTSANEAYRKLCDTKNLDDFVAFLMGRGMDQQKAEEAADIIKRLINTGVFASKRRLFMSCDKAEDYPGIIDQFITETVEISRQYIWENDYEETVKAYINFLIGHPDNSYFFDPPTPVEPSVVVVKDTDEPEEKEEEAHASESEEEKDFDWDAYFTGPDGKLSRIANPTLIDLLRPALNTEYRSIANALAIIEEFYEGKFESMAGEDWIRLALAINWEHPYASLNETPEEPERKKQKTHTLKVSFPDGRIIQHRQAAKTYIEVIQDNFPDLISLIGIIHAGVNIVSDSLDAQYHDHQHEIPGGWYVFTNTRTDTKRDDLIRISEELDLGLQVELVPLPDIERGKKDSSEGRRKVRVTFPDGRTIQPNKVGDALVEVVRYAGAEKVRALNIEVCEDNLVLPSPHPKYVVASKPLGDGWYVNISGDTARRYEHMCQISDRLQLGLKVDLI